MSATRTEGRAGVATAADGRQNSRAMHGDLFDSTIPFGDPDLMRASTYERYLDEELRTAPTGSMLLGASRPAELSPSLQADLGGTAQSNLGGYSAEAVEVVAACIRHASRVTIHLRCGGRALPLTIFPHERLVHGPSGSVDWLEKHLSRLEVLHLEPARRQPPADSVEALGDRDGSYLPLTPLLWKLALRGPRRELLPQIAGPAVYRVSPAVDIGRLPIRGAARDAVARLQREAVSLATLAGWPALTRERAARLLNALYLHAGLIVSRSHPQAGR